MYLNPGSGMFAEAVASEVFVDKTAVISCLNSCVGTNKKYLCASRPRRFGKTMAADMVCAYYERSGDGARELFQKRVLAGTELHLMPTGETRSWDAFLGVFDVVRITVMEFLKRGRPMEECLN